MQNVRGHVRGRAVCAHRRAHHRAAGARHREQLLHVLLAHTGQIEAAQTEAARPARRGRTIETF